MGDTALAITRIVLCGRALEMISDAISMDCAMVGSISFYLTRNLPAVLIIDMELLFHT